MVDPAEVLKPLAQADSAIGRLHEYQSAHELARALGECWDAVQRTLRLLLRSDAGAPDELRLRALSASDLPTDRLLDALRQRKLISLELAGTVHELEQVAARAARGVVRAADADLARRVLERLRAEVHALEERPVREVVHHAVETRALSEPPESVPPPDRSAARRWRSLVLSLAALVVVVVIVVLLFGRGGGVEKGVAAFEAGRLEAAEERFQDVLEREPENVTALLYLGRIYRRKGLYQEAARVLERAASASPEDDDVRRELGRLFMNLNRPMQAAEQFRRALEADPEDEKNWIGLIQALRAAGDARAEEYLRRAPPSVRAVLGGRGASRT
ncbi:MAG: tetratricopeptide repeat protein [Gemmatimonadetes bacterium]|nr:tetratricopeptide repeat protein [Gemmatimonadota bacterium]